MSSKTAAVFSSNLKSAIGAVSLSYSLSFTIGGSIRFPEATTAIAKARGAGEVSGTALEYAATAEPIVNESLILVHVPHASARAARASSAESR